MDLVSPFLSTHSLTAELVPTGKGGPVEGTYCRPVICLLLQLSDSARQTKTEAEISGPEEASVSPMEALLCFQRRYPFSAEAIQPRVNRLGPGHLWCE